MINIDMSLFIQMANFLIFLVLMNSVLYRPIRRIVAQRKRLISEKQEGIERLEEQTGAAMLEYDRGLEGARKAGALRIQELRAAGREEEKELLLRISEQTAAAVKEVREKIQHDITLARKELKQQVKVFSADLAQKILGRKV